MNFGRNIFVGVQSFINAIKSGQVKTIRKLLTKKNGNKKNNINVK